MLGTYNESINYKTILFKLLNKNPSERLGFKDDDKEILKHPWF